MITTKLIENARVERGIPYTLLAQRVEIPYKRLYSNLTGLSRNLQPDETVRLMNFFGLTIKDAFSNILKTKEKEKED